MKFPIFLAIITILDIIAVVSARYYVEKKQKWILHLSLATFVISGYIYVQLLAFAVTAIINILYAAFSAIFTTFFYFAVFKERVTKEQWMGILIAFAGIILLEV